MNLKQLRYFICIAKVGSLSKASEVLSIAQPALSKQLQKLEEELGVELLTRHSRGVMVNDVGLMMQQHFTAILREIDRTQDLVRDYTLNPAGEVTLGIPTTAARALTAPLVARVHQQFPKINMHVVEAMSGSLNDSLHLGLIDLTVLYNPRPPLGIGSNIDYTPVLREDLFLISKNKEQINNRKTIPFAMLEDLPLVVPCSSNTLARLLYDEAEKNRIKLNVKFEIDSLSGIIELVDSNFFTILPKLGLYRELEQERMVATPITDPQLYWNVYVATAYKGIRSRAVRVVHRTLLDLMVEMVKNGEWKGELL
jgi:LysR family nitrogen assimilation transcriptional regulator